MHPGTDKTAGIDEEPITMQRTRRAPMDALIPDWIVDLARIVSG